jgi:hypothetical protein
MKAAHKEQQQVKGPRLILHFDINKTITLFDQAQRLSKEETVRPQFG